MYRYVAVIRNDRLEVRPQSWLFRDFRQSDVSEYLPNQNNYYSFRCIYLASAYTYHVGVVFFQWAKCVHIESVNDVFYTFVLVTRFSRKFRSTLLDPFSRGSSIVSAHGYPQHNKGIGVIYTYYHSKLKIRVRNKLCKYFDHRLLARGSVYCVTIYFVWKLYVHKRRKIK